MSLRITEGETLEISETFIDDFDDPYIPAEGQSGPEVKLIDTRGNKPLLVASKSATPDPSVAGKWFVDLGVPVLDLKDVTDFQVVWTLLDEEHCTHKVKHVLQVEPSSQNRITDIVLLIKKSSNFLNFSVPFPYDENKHIVTFDIYKGNEALVDELPATDASVEIRVGRELTHFKFPAVTDTRNFEPHSLMVNVENIESGRVDAHTYKVWAVTPQVLVATTLVEDHINKARLANVIPELEYTQQDLVQYCYRGLNLFNQLPPRLTAFSGMNMQGILLDGWVTCSCYFALAAQLQAEGAMAFDFGGQSVNFTVDRSPAIEAALGRIESQISETVKPTKVLLGKAGIFTGDGSVGSKFISGAQNFGMLGITESPTTKFRMRARSSRIRRG